MTMMMTTAVVQETLETVTETNAVPKVVWVVTDVKIEEILVTDVVESTPAHANTVTNASLTPLPSMPSALEMATVSEHSEGRHSEMKPQQEYFLLLDLTCLFHLSFSPHTASSF